MTKSKPKSYAAHEDAYRIIEKKGLSSWNEFIDKEQIEPTQARMMENYLEAGWIKTKGRALDLGCGTGPLLRWLHSLGWKGTGVDMSKTAIKLARRQSKGLGLSFKVGDVTRLEGIKDRSFDLVNDGHCLHCITDPEDRKAFFSSARRVLKPGGLLIVDTMVRPVLKDQLITEGRDILRGNVLFSTIPNAEQYEHAIQIKGQWYMPHRYFEYWKHTLKTIQALGFMIRAFSLVTCFGSTPNSQLTCAATKEGT